MGEVFIGTSGFSYDHWAGVFYPEELAKREWLKFYAQHFKTVEINASFYHLPKRKTFENWRKRTPEDFVFSVKGSRYITHIKKLVDCQEPVEKFFERAEGLLTPEEDNRMNSVTPEDNRDNRMNSVNPGMDKTPGVDKAVVLWQLPPRLKADLEKLKSFLGWLPQDWRQAFEFRHQSWLNKEVFDLLGQHKAAVVFQDFPHWPITEKPTADFVYLRFHGRRELYASCYTKEELKDWAKKMKNWQKKGLDIYGYFNNDMKGYAVKNARKIIKMIKKNE